MRADRSHTPMYPLSSNISKLLQTVVGWSLVLTTRSYQDLHCLDLFQTWSCAAEVVKDGKVSIKKRFSHPLPHITGPIPVSHVSNRWSPHECHEEENGDKGVGALQLLCQLPGSQATASTLNRPGAGEETELWGAVGGRTQPVSRCSHIHLAYSCRRIQTQVHKYRCQYTNTDANAQKQMPIWNHLVIAQRFCLTVYHICTPLPALFESPA